MPAGSLTAIGDLSLVVQILLAAAPLAALMLVGTLVFFWMLWDHQRRLMIISRGGQPPPRMRPERLGLTGFVSLFVGVALMLFFWATQGVDGALLIGLIPAAAGAAIVTYQRLCVRFSRSARERGRA